jgi:hypothetical protein
VSNYSSNNAKDDVATAKTLPGLALEPSHVFANSRVPMQYAQEDLSNDFAYAHGSE